MTEDISSKVADFFSQYKLRHYDRGQIIVFSDDNPQHIYYLVSGIVRKYDVSYRGDEIVVNVFKPGSFFPMSWAINQTKNEYFYQAADNVELRLADPQATVEFLRDNPDVMFDLLSRIYKGADGLLRRMVHLMGGSAKSRLMYEVLVECRRFGENKPSGECIIKITETELAARAGLSRETVSREFKKINDEGLLKISGGKITIQDIGTFEHKLSKIV